MKISFFAGTLEEEDKKTADKLVEMFRFYDALAMIEMGINPHSFYGDFLRGIMDKEKLYKILQFNKSHNKEISAAKNIFYDCIGRQNPIVISDMQTLAQLIFDNKGYKFMRIPMKSKEIGAFQLRYNNSNYLVLNTSKSLANNNFAIAHELYHVLIQNNSVGNTGELYLNNYDEIEEEQMANAFAGAIIMPIEDVKSVVGLLEKECTHGTGTRFSIYS